MKDVAFYYRKKNGIKVSDSGLADVFLGGKGISVKIQISSTMEDRANGASLFKVKSVNVKVDALKFAIRDVSSKLRVFIPRFISDTLSFRRANTTCCTRRYARWQPV